MLAIRSRLVVAAGLSLSLGLFAGCQRAKSANPLSPSVAGPIAGVSIQAPQPMDPASSAQIAVDQQPVTLTVQNATTNGVRPLNYIFEIATDAGFSTKVFTQTGVQPGANDRTSLRLSQSLAAERTYYWRAKADDGANASDYSTAVSFRVYTPVIIQPPTLQAPGDGVTISTRRPTLVVDNAQRTGPAGDMQYLFEGAADPTMANRVVSVLVNEGSGQTSYAVPDDLAYATRYYWRVKALDPGHQSNYSNIQSFVTPPAPVVVAPPANPSPSPSPAPSPGGPAGNDGINMSQATILNSPSDLASWPVTSALTLVSMQPSGVHVEFSKADGPGRWPDVYPPGWSEPLQYTLGMCMNLGGRWYCSAPIQVLVRTVPERRAAVAVRAELVLRSGAVGTDGRTPAVARRDDRHLRVRRRLPQYDQGRQVGRPGAHQRRPRADARQRRRDVSLLRRSRLAPDAARPRPGQQAERPHRQERQQAGVAGDAHQLAEVP